MAEYERAVAKNLARVDVLISQDREDQSKERLRKMAEMELAHGVFVNLSDSVIEPTLEWLAKAENQTFIPKQPDNTARVIKSVRRVLVPAVSRIHKAGKLNDEQLSACLWYRNRFEHAGLEGRWSTSSFSDTSGTGSGLGSAPMPMHHEEAVARQEFRAARTALSTGFLKFFDAVVLGDVSVHRAARFARCREQRAPVKFRECADKMVSYCSAKGQNNSYHDQSD